MECNKCTSENVVEEIAWIVTGQIDGERESMVLIVCQDCGAVVKEDEGDEGDAKVSP